MTYILTRLCMAGAAVENLPPRSATVKAHFDARETRTITYELSHPKRLFGQTEYGQTVRFCPRPPDSGPDDPDPEPEPSWYSDGDPPDDEDVEEIEHPDPDDPEEPGQGGGVGGGDADEECPVHGVPYEQCATLHEVHLPVGAHISGICNWNDEYNYSVGGRIAEMVVYERELSAREKVATRNYLMKKWLGTADADLQPLPAARPVSRTLVAVSGDGTVVADSLALSKLVADATAASVPSVTGTVALDDEVEIVVVNASELGREDVFVPGVACAAATGLSACAPTFSGDVSWMSAGKKAELAYENGALGVRFRAPRGLMLMLK